jgi:hypothetical protein
LHIPHIHFSLTHTSRTINVTQHTIISFQLDKVNSEVKEGIQSVFKLKDAMEQAYGAQRKGDHTKASEAAAVAINIAPYDFKMYAVRATACYKHQQWAECVDECMKCAQATCIANPKVIDKLNREDDLLRGKVDSGILSSMKFDRKDRENFGVLTCGRIINAKMFQMLVPALRYSHPVFFISSLVFVTFFCLPCIT